MGSARQPAESPKKREGFSPGPPPSLERAKTLRNAGDLKGAEQMLRSMIQRSPGDVDAMVALANLYLGGLDKPQKAYALYQKALLVDPSKASVQANLGVYYLRKGDLDQAKTHIVRALELSPGTAEVHYNMSCIHALEGDLGKAEKALARAIQIDPRCADWAIEDPDLDSLRNRTGKRKTH
jgi:Flp pilus assembly protein TadD